MSKIPPKILTTIFETTIVAACTVAVIAEVSAHTRYAVAALVVAVLLERTITRIERGVAR